MTSNVNWQALTNTQAGGLLGGIVPKNPRNRRELLILSLLAVTLDHQRLRDEFGQRSHLAPQARTVDLVEYQQKLSANALGTAGPLETIDQQIATKAQARGLSVWTRTGESASWTSQDDDLIAWAAAVRFGDLAATIAEALGLPARIPFFRTLAGQADHPNAVGCYREPWEQATEAAIRAGGIMEFSAEPAAIIAVVTSQLPRGGLHGPDKHPSDCLGESGHPVIAAIAPARFGSPAPIPQPTWRKVDAAHIRANND